MCLKALSGSYSKAMPQVGFLNTAKKIGSNARNLFDDQRGDMNSIPFGVFLGKAFSRETSELQMLSFA